MARIACILVADFSLAAIIRANPALRGAPLVLSRNSAPHAELIAVSPAARAAGVRIGTTLAQARAALPDLIAALPSTAAECSAADALLDVAESLSPLVEAGAPGCAWLDLAGLGRLYGSEDEIAAELLHRAWRAGMEASVGIAANKEVAHLAARCGGRRIIAPEMERRFLDWLPLDLLFAEDRWQDGGDLAATLARWGIRRLGDLARLDIRALGSRLGRPGVELARLARGGVSSPLVARRRSAVFIERIELGYGIETLEPLSFVMRAMVERLVERIAMRGMAAGDMTLSLGLADRRRDSRAVAVAAATNEARSLLALLMLSLEASPPAAAVEEIQITLEPRIARPAQTDMFAPPAPTPARLQSTLARLAAMCGTERVGTMVPGNSYRPEAARIEPFDPPPAIPQASGGNGGGAGGNVARLVIRTIRPAVEVEVMSTRGMPDFVRGPNLSARVVSFAGPWRQCGEWWREGGFNREYYEATLDDSGVYRLYRDLRAQRWYLDGMYD